MASGEPVGNVFFFLRLEATSSKMTIVVDFIPPTLVSLVHFHAHPVILGILIWVKHVKLRIEFPKAAHTLHIYIYILYKSL